LYPAQPWAYFRPDTLVSPLVYNQDLLHTDGTTSMQTQLRLIEGSPSVPSQVFAPDEKCGDFHDGIGRRGFAIGGQRRLVLCDAGIEVWDLHGGMVGIMGPTDVLARSPLALSAGMALANVAGVLLEPTVVPADASEEGNVAVGVAAWNTAAGGITLVRCSVLTLPDWTASTGGPSLLGMHYYLGVGGLLVTTPGTQYIGCRVGPQTLLVRCSPEAALLVEVDAVVDGGFPFDAEGDVYDGGEPQDGPGGSLDGGFPGEVGGITVDGGAPYSIGDLDVWDGGQADQGPPVLLIIDGGGP
jgi:hypothetical protein